MSILQQGDSSGELCVADFCKEGAAVSRGRKRGTRKTTWTSVKYIAIKDMENRSGMLGKVMVDVQLASI